MSDANRVQDAARGAEVEERIVPELERRLGMRFLPKAPGELGIDRTEAITGYRVEIKFDRHYRLTDNFLVELLAHMDEAGWFARYFPFNIAPGEMLDGYVHRMGLLRDRLWERRPEAFHVPKYLVYANPDAPGFPVGVYEFESMADGVWGNRARWGNEWEIKKGAGNNPEAINLMVPIGYADQDLVLKFNMED